MKKENYFFINIRGEIENIPEELESIGHLLQERAELERDVRDLDKKLGSALAPILKELEKKRDTARLAYCADAISKTGSALSRFFWEKMYHVLAKNAKGA